MEGRLDPRKIGRRIESLRAERESGALKLAELEAEAAQVRETLLRLDGAIQVLEEIADETGPET